MEPTTLAAVIDPSAAGMNIRGWLIILIGVALLGCSLVALVRGALRGNSGNVMRIVIASMLALIPGVFALGVGWQMVGNDVVGIFGGTAQ